MDSSFTARAWCQPHGLFYFTAASLETSLSFTGYLRVISLWIDVVPWHGHSNRVHLLRTGLSGRVPYEHYWTDQFWKSPLIWPGVSPTRTGSSIWIPTLSFTALSIERPGRIMSPHHVPLEPYIICAPVFERPSPLLAPPFYRASVYQMKYMLYGLTPISTGHPHQYTMHWLGIHSMSFVIVTSSWQKIIGPNWLQLFNKPIYWSVVMAPLTLQQI
jgi:hypothetical protein